MLNIDIQMHLKTMNKIPFVRYKYISKFVYNLLHDNQITSYPININDLIDVLNFHGSNIQTDTYDSYLSYKNLMQTKKGLPPLKYTDIINIFGSPDGATARIYGTSLNIIFYNDKEPVAGRINWTLAHELGHILLQHHDIMTPIFLQRRSSKQINTQYDILEKEADWFARTLLCHPYILDQNGVRTWDEIMTVCNISYTAAINRERDIKTKHYIINTPWDENILLQIDKIIRHCVKCNCTLYDARYIYCPICGNKNTLRWGNGIMDYKEYETTVEGFLETCIRCGNKKIIGNYCQICGAPVRNYCTNYYLVDDNYQTCYHSEPLPGNARFCPDCGSKSLFFHHNILNAWDIEYNQFMENEALEANIPTASDGFMNVPDKQPEKLPWKDDIDEELPFN